MAASKEVEAYFAEASRWEFDRSESQAAATRRAWIVALAAVTAALVATGAVAMLTPLKHVEPFVVRVDSSTGVVDVVPGYAGNESLPQSVSRYLVTQYVTARERYVAAIAEADYDQVGACHTAAMNQQWAAMWSKTNPESPLNRYVDGTQVHVQVQSVSFLRDGRDAPQIVQVRFATSTERGGVMSGDRAHYVSTMQVAFGPPSTDVGTRALNPLGFKVLEYRRESEAPEPVVPPPNSHDPAPSVTSP